MKLSNADMIQLTEIKQYFLEPPLSFKLPAYAAERLETALGVLRKYSFIKEDEVQLLESLQADVKQSNLTGEGLKTRLREAGILISRLTSR